MELTRRIALTVTVGALAVTTAPFLGPVLPAGASPAASRTTHASVAVHGTLLVAPAERPGGHPAYAVALADGDLVPIRGSLGGARPLSVITGQLTLPATVASTLVERGTDVRAGSVLTASSDAGRDALRLVDHRSLTLRVAGTPTLSDPAPSVTPTTHQQYVAAIDNKGALGQDDPTLLGHVSTVGTYWEGESNGAISGIGVPATVTHYNTALSTTDCGLGNDFFNVIQEAEAKFPGINLFGGSDQLVLFVPSACASGNVVGEGTVGSSFASGGALIVKAGTAIDGTYAHETGHNYGFAHANARYSGTSMEYFGVYDVMGFALGGFNQLTALSTPFRVFQGITDADEIQDVPLGDQSAPVHVSVTIKPRADDSGMRSLRVQNPDTGESLYLDYRSGTAQDVGAFYTASGYYLNSSNGPMHYAPGVTINAARGGSGVDTLVVDGNGDTSLGAGATWTNASGNLTIQVTALSATGADVTVDVATPQAFATVGVPAIGGDPSVGGAVSLDTGTWSPTPTTTTIRWTANGAPVTNLNDLTAFTPAPVLLGKQLVASVTEARSGYQTTTVQSLPVTVTPGAIAVTADPGVTGSALVGSTLHATSGTWGTLLSTVTSTWQWRSDGVDIPSATTTSYTVQPGDVGHQLSVAQHLTATGYAPTTIVSSETDVVPQPVISPAPKPTVSGTPRVGAPLQASTGTWMGGVTLTYQWFVNGVVVDSATGTTYTPVSADQGSTARVDVTGTRPGYPNVTRSSAESAPVALGLLSAAKPTLGGKPQVGRTLTARPGTWTSGTTFAYAWYADGKRIKGQKAKKLVLTKAQRGKRITVKVTGRLPGYADKSVTSAKTARIT